MKQLGSRVLKSIVILATAVAISACVYLYWYLNTPIDDRRKVDRIDCSSVVLGFIDALRNLDTAVAKQLVEESQRQKVEDWIEINPNRSCRATRLGQIIDDPLWQGSNFNGKFRWITFCNGTSLNLEGTVEINQEGYCEIQTWAVDFR